VTRQLKRGGEGGGRAEAWVVMRPVMIFVIRKHGGNKTSGEKRRQGGGEEEREGAKVGEE